MTMMRAVPVKAVIKISIIAMRVAHLKASIKINIIAMRVVLVLVPVPVPVKAHMKANTKFKDCRCNKGQRSELN